jgi:hypothetical protein
LDPRIREIQEQGLSKNNNLYNELGAEGQSILGNLRNTRSRYEGNQSAYIKSQTNPIEQELTQRQGGLERSIGLRGVAGSSFGDQSLTNFGVEKERAISDTRAKAEMENLQALTGIDSQYAQTLFTKVQQQAALTGADNETAKAMLMQEMQALGLDQKQSEAMAKTYEEYQRRLLTAGPYESGASGSAEGGGGGGSSIICTAMNEAYGFGDYRNKIWVKFGVTRMTNDHRLGYHYLFLPLVRYGFKSGNKLGNRIVRKALEHIAIHRTIDLRAVMHGYDRDPIGMVYRFVLEPTCRFFGILIRKGIINKAKGT